MQDSNENKTTNKEIDLPFKIQLTNYYVQISKQASFQARKHNVCSNLNTSENKRL